MRNLRYFSSIERRVDAVFLEVEDSRIRFAYESRGVPVSLISALEQKNMALAPEMGAGVFSTKKGASDVVNSRKRSRSS